MRKKIVAGNWKMNKTVNEAVDLVQELGDLLTDDVVGETTSGDWGYRINASIALGVVRADLAIPGTELEIEMYGQRYKAVVQPDQPLWDPQNERLRA